MRDCASARDGCPTLRCRFWDASGRVNNAGGSSSDALVILERGVEYFEKLSQTGATALGQYG
jgi:hypothetical protein